MKVQVLSSAPHGMARFPEFDADRAELESRIASLEPAATELFVAVMKAIRRGDIPDRGRIDDAALQLRDALNPDELGNPDWLPPELTE